MIQHIEGNRYDYTIKYLDNGVFEVSTIRKKDGRKSSITNLNMIIGEIIEPVLNTNNIEDSHLEIKERAIGEKLYKRAVRIFSDKQWISKYLECQLDDDMQDEDEYDDE